MAGTQHGGAGHCSPRDPTDQKAERLVGHVGHRMLGAGEARPQAADPRDRVGCATEMSEGHRRPRSASVRTTPSAISPYANQIEVPI